MASVEFSLIQRGLPVPVDGVRPTLLVPEGHVGEGVVPLRVFWTVVLHHRRLLVVLALLGALVGVVVFLVLAPGYTSRTRVVLQGVRESSQMQSEAQIAMSQVVLERAAGRMPPGSGVPFPPGKVTATSDGNVVEILTTADAPARARQLAELVTGEYVNFSRQLLTDAVTFSTQSLKDRQNILQQRLDEANRGIRELLASGSTDALTVAGAQARADLNRLRAEAGDAVEELNQLYARMQDAEAEASVARAGTRVIETPTEPAPAPPTLVQLAVGGGVGAPVIAAVALLIAHGRGRRLVVRADIAAALGAPVLGRLAAPPQQTPERRRGPLRRVRRVARAGPPSQPRDDEELHYRRAVDRVRGELGSVLWVAVAAEDDPDSQRAAALLAGVSQRMCGHVVNGGAPVGGAAVGTAAVSPGRPLLPDVGNAAAAIVLLAPGTRVGEELLGVAEACVDAGCPVRGVLLVERPVEDRGSPAAGVLIGDDDTHQVEPERRDGVVPERNGQHVGGLA